MGTAPVSIGNLPYTTPDISSQKADLAASKTINDQLLADEKAQSQLTQDQLINQNQSILDKIFKKQQSIQDVRQDYEKYYKIQAQQAKVQSLTEDYNALIAQRDQQIAQESSRFGLQDFTNNRIAQIENNAAPKINQLSADIKFETALLTQKQELVQQAVNDYFKEEDRKLTMYQMYMENNKDLISRLDKKEQDAIDKAFELKVLDIKEAKDIRSMVAEYAFKYPEAGIDWKNDTAQQAIQKLKDSGVGNDNTSIDTLAQALIDKNIEISQVPSELRAEVLQRKKELENFKPTQSLKLGILQGSRIALNNAGFSSSDIKEIKNMLKDGVTLESIFSANPEYTPTQRALLEMYVQ